MLGYYNLLYIKQLENSIYADKHLLEIEIFCNIINDFSITFNQFNALLLKSIKFFNFFVILPQN